jgi:hypothetical protein
VLHHGSGTVSVSSCRPLPHRVQHWGHSRDVAGRYGRLDMLIDAANISIYRRSDAVDNFYAN